MILEIKELDPDMIRPSMENVRDPDYTRGGSKITVIGKAGTGKSFLISSLIYDKRACFPTGIVMSGTEDSNHHYSQMFPSTFVYNGLRTDVLEKLINRQKIAKKYIASDELILIRGENNEIIKRFIESEEFIEQLDANTINGVIEKNDLINLLIPDNFLTSYNSV